MPAQFSATRSCIVAALMAMPLAALAQEAPAITPYRPSASNPAQLPATGQLEFEAGWLAASSADGHRDSVPVLFKYAFSEQWGVLLGGEAWVASRPQGAPRVPWVGDTSITLKRAFAIDDATAFGLELGAKLPTAKDDIGSGHTDYTLNTIFSRDFGKLHMDANANLTRQGMHEAGTSGPVAGLSAAFSHPIDDHWSALAELSGNHQRGAGSSTQALMGVAYSPSKRLTVDLGFSHSLHADTSSWAWFSGFVVPLGQLR